MTISLAFYSDSGLTTPLVSLAVTQAADGSSAAVDRVVYLGSTVSGKSFQAASNPGVDQVSVSIADAATGGGVQAAHVKLATSQANLASATAGVALNLGTSVASGVANARAIWVRIDTPALTSGVYDDVSMTTNTLVEV